MGFGGLTNKFVVQSGLQSELEVRAGQVVRSVHRSALLYRFGDQPRDFASASFPDFSVATGDVLTTSVWTNRERWPNTEVYAWIYNENHNRWSSVGFRNIRLEATSAQWIAGGRIPLDPNPFLLPNFDNVIFWNGFSYRENNKGKVTIREARARNAPEVPLTALISGNLVSIRRITSSFDSKALEAEDY